MENNTNTVFRSKIEPTPISEEPARKTEEPKERVVSITSETEVEVPYTNYQDVHKKPFSADYYKLSDFWDDPEGGFTDEVSALESYFNHKIQNGDIADSLPAIRRELKGLEKINNIKNEERVTVKLGILSAYVKFLMESDKVKYNVRKFGR